MTFEERLAAIRAGMEAAGLDVLIGIHDGAHFIETPNPVMVLAGFKGVGPAACLLRRDGERELIVTPEWERERAAELCPGVAVHGAQDLVPGLMQVIGHIRGRAIGIAGRSPMPWRIAGPLAAALPGARDADALVSGPARRKTRAEIADARRATEIAEAGLAYLVKSARLDVTEDELAVELKWHSRTLDAEDNFLLLCAGPHNRAVQPSTGRKLQPGDILLAEITPSYRGQLAQICRTIVLGPVPAVLADKYALVVAAMNQGIAAARPGVPMAEVCRAIDRVLEAEGYGEFCRPPHIRRRGHGLGFASIRPGDVSLDNDTVLEPDMVFMIHPNQYLPETGYLLCGEPVLMTATGAEPLTRQQASLVAID